MRNKLFNYITIFIILASIPLYWQLFNILELKTNILTYIGLCIMMPALALFIIARIQLGSSFQVSAEASKLVTGGIYKKIRHPIYLFGLLFILGVILVFQMPFLLIFWIGLIFLQMKRIKNEEKVLEKAFGEEYRSYKKDTWF